MTSLLTPSDWADAIASRVNNYGIGEWLPALGEWLGFSDDRWLPRSREEGRLRVPAPRRGLQLQLYMLEADKANGTRKKGDRIVLEEAVFNGELIAIEPRNGAFSFGLDAQNDTPDSVAQKIGHYDIVGNNTERSYFLEDARVVGVTFNRHLHGIHKVQVVRLGEAQLFKG